MGEQKQVFLTAAQCGGEMSVSDIGCFISRQRHQQPNVQKADGILEAVWTQWGREIEPQFLSCLARSVVTKTTELPWLILSYTGQPNIL